MLDAVMTASISNLFSIYCVVFLLLETCTSKNSIENLCGSQCLKVLDSRLSKALFQDHFGRLRKLHAVTILSLASSRPNGSPIRLRFYDFILYSQLSRAGRVKSSQKVTFSLTKNMRYHSLSKIT